MAYLLRHLLTESVARLPDQEAVRFERESLTYAQLDRVTNQVARALRRVGVRRGDRVGILVHKSMTSVIGLFGITKAGAAYVPLDPNAPARRLAYIARNCGIRVVLTSSQMLEKVTRCLEEDAPIETVVMADVPAAVSPALPNRQSVVTWDQVCTEEEGPVAPDGTIETDLAYILYTSGSTGEPKGVMISHRAVFTFINWCYEAFRMGPADRVTSHAPLHFDLSTFDLFVTLKAGGTIVLVPEQLSMFPVRFVKLLQDEGITVTYLVPSVLALMVNYGRVETQDLSRLRAVLFAGEVLPVKYLRRLAAAIPHADFYNLYGPTETNVCTYYKVRERDLDPQRSRPLPIGVACENTEVFAVDGEGKPVTAPGQEGELWVRGSCVAQGYWGDPEKTAKGFVRNQLQAHFSEVAYRTGDVVTLDEDGVNWLFLGRRDHMVKSRGYRIELGDIESALYGHQGVKEAVVVAVPDELVGNRLKAYVVPLKGGEFTEKDIQVHCGQRLPRYMVPEAVVFLGELPKTSTGKVDRALLRSQTDGVLKTALV